MVFRFEVSHLTLLLLDVAADVRNEHAGLLQLLVQIADRGVNRVSHFGQSDNLAGVLLKLCRLFFISTVDMAGTFFLVEKLIFLLLSAFQNGDFVGEFFALSLKRGQLRLEGVRDVLDVFDMVLKLLNLLPDLVYLIGLHRR